MIKTGLLAFVMMLLLSCRKAAPADDSARYAHLVAFDSATMGLVSGKDTARLRVELATSTEQERMGLMERRHLGADAGMLFVFDSTQAADAGFWMYRTRIPLDIAFMDSTGVVRSTRTMAPCQSELIEGCPAYAPGVPYRYALEVNSGYLAGHHFGVGTVALLPSKATAAAASPRQSPHDREKRGS